MNEEQQFMDGQSVGQYQQGFNLNPKIPSTPSQDFFWFRLSSEDILESLRHQLMGEIEATDAEGNSVFKKMFEPWANEEGINKILYVVYSCGINKSTILGCLTHDDINTKCRSLWKNLARMFCMNYKQFGVDKESRNLLVRSVVYTVHSALSRSEEGRESEQLSIAHQRIEHMNLNTPEKQSGIFSSLNPFRRDKK